jgi:uncharacterized protein (DUF305 family)
MSARVLLAFAFAVIAGAFAAATALTAHSVDPPFAADSKAAMAAMMTDMNVASSGDADQDFARMMIPHHEGAIAMAQAELRYGRNEQLRRIAQEIIIDQRQEIAAMQLALGGAAPPATGAATPSSEASLATKICSRSVK